MRLSVFETAAAQPAAEALVAGKTLTWSAVADRVRTDIAELVTTLEVADANALRGLPIGLVGHADARTVIRLLALFEVGAAIVTVHPQAPWSRRWAQLSTTAATLVCDRDQVLPVPAPGSQSLHPDCALVVFTSGSTGTPKGVMISAAALIASAQASAKNLGWRDDDRWLLDLPLAHVGGVSVVTRCLLAGRAICVDDPSDSAMGSDDPSADAQPQGTLAQMTAQRVTLASLVPTQLSRVMAEIRDGGQVPAALRAVLVGGGATSPALAREARAAGLPILLTWGATEAASQIATQAPEVARTLSDEALSSVGAPLAGTLVETRDGRAYVKSPTLMLGYHPPGLHPSPFRDGWLQTNDRITFNNGTLRVLGRADDVIISGGENVSPSAVETRLRTHPDVLDVGVTSVADPEWGQRLVAAVVWKSAQAPEDFDAWSRGQLSAWERPRETRSVDALPTGANGKLDRAALASWFTD